MAIEKNKILGAVLELPAKQHCQFKISTKKLNWMGWIGSVVWLVAPKQPPGFWFFQWTWIPIIHLSLFPLIHVPPQFKWHNKSFLGSVVGKFSWFLIPFPSVSILLLLSVGKFGNLINPQHTYVFGTLENPVDII